MHTSIRLDGTVPYYDTYNTKTLSLGDPSLLEKHRNKIPSKLISNFLALPLFLVYFFYSKISSFPLRFAPVNKDMDSRYAHIMFTKQRDGRLNVQLLYPEQSEPYP